MNKIQNTCNTACFSICSINYLPTAKILIDSLESKFDGDIYLIVCDKPNKKINNLFKGRRVTILFAEQLKIQNFDEFIFRYSILELNTAIKPFVFKYLFKKKYENVIYFDPDIIIEDRLNIFEELLLDNDAILIPHLLSPYSDTSNPSLEDIKNSGIYNLGFLALKNKGSRLFLDWWSQKCRFHCFSDTENGFFTDQKFCDFLPIFVPKTHIYKRYDSNIAYWNLHERKITKKNNFYYSNNQKVIFFHFSGLVYNKSFEFLNLSKHENRFGKNIDKSLKSKIRDYLLLLKHNSGELKKLKIDISYGFDKYNDIEIDQYIRSYLKKLGDSDQKHNLKNINKDWFLSGTNEFHEFALVPRYFLGIYFFRKDLQKAFNLKIPKGQESFYDWIAHEISIGNIKKEYSKLIPKKKSRFNLKILIKNKIFRILKRIYFLNPNFFSNRVFDKFRYYLRRFFSIHHDDFQEESSKNISLLPPYVGSTLDKNGVNIFGYFKKHTGLAIGVNLLKNLFKESNISLSKHNVNIEDNSLISAMDKDVKDWDISLFHINADQTANFAPALEEKFINTYKIGFWLWELEKFPSDYLVNAKFLNDIWVPSNFIADSIERSCFFRPKVIPYPVLKHDKNNLEINTKYKFSKKFIVTGIFDLNSYIDRKNPFGIIDAFSIACKNNNFKKNAQLVLKISGNFNKKQAISKIKKTAKNLNISLTIIDVMLSASEMESLRNITDVFISLHRSEGFGLNMIENMNAGNTVIATKYSANLDFMDSTNSLLVDYDLMPIREGQYPSWESQFWADPHIEDAAEKLLWAYNNPKKTENISRKAEKYIHTNHSVKALSKILKEEIRKI